VSDYQLLSLKCPTGFGNDCVVELDGKDITLGVISVDIHADTRNFVTATIVLECQLDVETLAEVTDV